MKSLFVALATFLTLTGIIFGEAIIFAQGSSSGYRIDESFIGPGGNLESGSTNYNFQTGQQSIGNTGVVEGSSSNYRTQGGFTTTSDPTLRCVINTASLNLGSLSTATTATANASFSVLNYTSYGYNVSIVGNSPGNGAHNLTALAANAASSPGNEQFGINLVANTNPTTFGTNPVQVPDSSFSFGAAASNYNTANSYRYVSGETIATAAQSSGQTDYTISYIVNVSTTTPGGSYNGNQAIVCTGTY